MLVGHLRFVLLILSVSLLSNSTFNASFFIQSMIFAPLRLFSFYPMCVLRQVWRRGGEEHEVRLAAVQHFWTPLVFIGKRF